MNLIEKILLCIAAGLVPLAFGVAQMLALRDEQRRWEIEKRRRP